MRSLSTLLVLLLVVSLLSGCSVDVSLSTKDKDRATRTTSSASEESSNKPFDWASLPYTDTVPLSLGTLVAAHQHRWGKVHHVYVKSSTREEVAVPMRGGKVIRGEDGVQEFYVKVLRVP